MDARIHFAVLASVGAAMMQIAVAQDRPHPLPVVHASAVLFVIDCDRRVLPTQRDVGLWTHQYNFSQVYITRNRLMGRIAQACQREGVIGVRVLAHTEGHMRHLRVVAMSRER